MKRVTKDGQVAVTTRPPLVTGIGDDVGVPDEYPFRLNTYLIPPHYDITVEKFEEFAFARLQCTEGNVIPL